MKVLNIATALSCAADGQSSIIDTLGQTLPFESGYTNLAVFSLNGVADAIVTLQESDSSTFASGVATVAQVDLTAAAATNGVRNLAAAVTKRYLRVDANEVTTGAGDVTVDLIGN